MGTGIATTASPTAGDAHAPGGARPDDAARGVHFPPGEDGSRSTSTTGRAVVADAARAVDGALADRVGETRDWRGGYLAPFRDLTAAGGASADAALAVARAGLRSLRERMVLADDDGERPLADGLGTAGSPAHATREVRGSRPPERELAVPYRGEVLRGDALRRRLDAWTVAGVVEPSFARAIETVAANPEWLALPGRRVALLGAGSEMGPLGPLCRWGADVLALDLPRPALWERVLRTAEEGAGTLRAPAAASAGSDGDGDGVGADLLTDLPAVRDWLAAERGDDDLVLATHAYADGGTHVRLSAAADALGEALAADRDALAHAWLATPTDVFLVPPEVIDASRERWRARRLRAIAQAPVRALSRGALFRAAYGEPVDGAAGRTWGVADVLVAQQGPNYSLAKRAQRWRGVVAEAEGRDVSFNVAPASWTRSVTSNRVLAAAYGGARRFGIEIFAPSTTRVLMAALLVHDLHVRPEPTGRHPDDLFADGAAHGGLWRSAYEPRTALPVAAVVGLHHALRRG